MASGTYAIIEIVKDKLAIALEDQDFEGPLKNKMVEADNWIERELSDLLTKPFSTTTYPDLIEIASMYSAGLWQMRNTSDVSKVPAYITLAKANLMSFRTHLVEAKENTKTTGRLGKTVGNVTKVT